MLHLPLASGQVPSGHFCAPPGHSSVLQFPFTSGQFPFGHLAIPPGHPVTGGVPPPLTLVGRFGETFPMAFMGSTGIVGIRAAGAAPGRAVAAFAPSHAANTQTAQIPAADIPNNLQKTDMTTPCSIPLIIPYRQNI